MQILILKYFNMTSVNERYNLKGIKKGLGYKRYRHTGPEIGGIFILVRLLVLNSNQ